MASTSPRTRRHVHPLEEKLNLVRRRLTQLTAYRGLACLAAVVVGGLLLLGALDFAVRWQDTGVRATWSLLFWMAVAAVAVAMLVRPLWRRPDDAMLARQVERHYPSLSDRLRSAVEFLHQSETQRGAGSLDLRRATVAQTAAEVERCDVAQVFDPRPAHRAAFGALALALIAATLAVVAPASAGVAAARVLLPWSDAHWPQTNRLQARRAPPVIARGDVFELEIVAAEGTKLPATATIFFRDDDGPQRGKITRQLVRPSGDAFVWRRENVEQSFFYRAEGGDDHSMPWTRVSVVDRPELIQLDVDLQPPGSSGLPAARLAASFRAMEGSRVVWRGRSSGPLRSASIVFDDGPTLTATLEGGVAFHAQGELTLARATGAPAADASTAGGAADEAAADQTAATVDARGGESQPPIDAIALSPDRPQTYHVRLVDRRGIESTAESAFTLQILPDRPPEVTIDAPLSPAPATPTAMVPILATVRDDLAIQSIELHAWRADATDPATPLLASVELYRGDDRPPATTLPGDRANWPLQAVEYRWSLASLGQSPGAAVAWEIVARDWRGQSSSSGEQRLTIVTPAEFESRMLARQTAIREELSRALLVQRTARDLTDTAARRLQTAARPDATVLEHLQTAAQHQRQVDERLLFAPDSAAAQIAHLLEALQLNGIADSEMVQRLQRAASEVVGLQQGPLPEVVARVSEAVKTGQIDLDQPAAEPGAAAEMRTSLSAALDGQQQVMTTLEELCERMGATDLLSGFYRRIADVRREQERLITRTGETGRQTLGKTLADLSPEAGRGLTALAAEQDHLGERLSDTLREMQRAGAAQRTADPAAARLLDAVAAQAATSAVVEQMHDAAGQVTANQIGQCVVRQRQVVADLQALLEILANRNAGAEGREQALAQAAANLADLRQRQQAVADELARGAQAHPNERQTALAETQRKLEGETRAIAEDLRRMAAAGASDATARAADQMQQAGYHAGQGHAAAAADRAQAAARTLEQAAAAMAQRQSDENVQAVAGLLKKAAAEVGAMRQKQQRILEQTQGLPQPPSPLRRDQAAAVIALAGEQSQLRDQTGALADTLAALPTIRWALQRAGEAMSRTATALDHRDVGPFTQDAATRSLGWLDLVLSALQTEQGAQPANPSPPSPPPGNKQGQQNNQRKVSISIADLRMLMLAQESLRQRTFARAEAEAEHAPAVEDYAVLEAEQAALAHLIEELVEAAAAGAEPADDPGMKEDGP